LPVPGGPYEIGTSVRHLVDPSRDDILEDAPRPRELMLQVWYPASSTAKGAANRPSMYVDDGSLMQPLEDLMGLPPGTLRHLETVQTHGLRDAPIAEDGPFPVLVFSHGRCGFRGHNTVLVEELASNGYVVATIDHSRAATGVRLPDGRDLMFDRRLLPPWPRDVLPGIDAQLMDEVLPFLAADVSFVIDELERMNQCDVTGLLTGKLEMSRLAAFGVSLGGMLAAEASVADARIGACLIIDVYLPDSVVKAGLRVPVMWITRDAGTMCLEGWSRADIDDTHRTMRNVYDRLPGVGYIVLVPGMFHVDFSDGRLLTPLIAELGLSGSVPLERALALVGGYSSAFFDTHVKGVPASLLQPEANANSDVLFESRVAPSRAHASI
jgi:dienelactone hydrolase